MNNEKIIHLITGYLQGTLSASENEQLQKLIEEEKLDVSEFAGIQKIYNELEPVKVPEPGQRMQQRFYAMLEAEKAKNSGFLPQRDGWFPVIANRQFRGIGFAMAIFIAGFLFGDLLNPFSNRGDKIDRLTSEVYQMREVMMISLLESDSSIERLRAVNISNEIPESDTRVAEALLRTLNNDANVNVRIAAVDALINHASNPAVRSGMIGAITRQESPLVQIALADAMIALQERESVDQFKKLLEQDDLNYNVRNKIENTILALN